MWGPLSAPKSCPVGISFARFKSQKKSLPRDPPVLKRLRRVDFGMGSKFGTEVAERYREGSEMLGFLDKKGRKIVQTVKNYGGRKILRIRAP